jgi:uncharacterized protein
MPRPRNKSKIHIPPRIKGFMPIGYYSNQTEPVILNIEEYESIRLLDYEGLSQEEAAKIMDVSRPTLTRIYERARNKMACALTEVRQLIIEGGNAIFGENWYECQKCLSKFNTPENSETNNCPLCKYEGITLIKA